MRVKSCSQRGESKESIEERLAKNIVKKVKVKFYSQFAARADPVAMARGTRSLTNLLHIPLYPNLLSKNFNKVKQNLMWDCQSNQTSIFYLKTLTKLNRGELSKQTTNLLHIPLYPKLSIFLKQDIFLIPIYQDLSSKYFHRTYQFLLLYQLWYS